MRKIINDGDLDVSGNISTMIVTDGNSFENIVIVLEDEYGDFDFEFSAELIDDLIMSLIKIRSELNYTRFRSV